ncbi:MAG: Holliday junction resolvase RuvX [Chloroflexota bacterium]
MRSLGLDIGDRRIGVAISDPGGILARPLTILERTSDQEAISAITEIIEKEDIQRVVVGLPLSLDGTIREQAEKVRAFAGLLAERVKVPLELRDERLTTVTAQRLMREARGKKKPPKSRKETHDDAIAAAVILQEYLDEAHDPVK